MLFERIREKTGNTDRQSDFAVLCERLSESSRSLRDAGVAAGLVPPVCRRFRSGDKAELGCMAERIREFLQGLRLSPHERKFRIYRCDEAVTLLGWRILPGQARLARP